MSEARAWPPPPMEVYVRLADEPELRNALLAVLDLHVPAIYLGEVEACYICEQDSWPCSTIRAIKKALGVDNE